MNRQIPLPAVIGSVVVVLLLGGFYAMHEASTGEVRNPNVGHPTKLSFKILSRSQADKMSEDNYIEVLKATRPELSDDERQKMADNWWRVKSGEAKPSSP